MSVISLSDPTSSLLEFYGCPYPEDCTLCGRPLGDPTVHWGCPGDGTRPWLHPDCAKELAACLFFDGELASRIEKGKPVTAGIDRKLRAAAAGAQPP